MNESRRGFIRKSCCTAAALGVASSFSRFGLIHALAQGATDFKALVCVFLFGGNDSNNMIVPMDPQGYSNYQTIRGVLANGGLALDQSSLLPITLKNLQNGTTAYGLHPNLPELETLFTSGKLAFLANVGTLSHPITRAQYQARSFPVPVNLFSHADQGSLANRAVDSGSTNHLSGHRFRTMIRFSDTAIARGSKAPNQPSDELSFTRVAPGLPCLRTSRA